jgi:hypothetical protein
MQGCLDCTRLLVERSEFWLASFGAVPAAFEHRRHRPNGQARDAEAHEVAGARGQGGSDSVSGQRTGKLRFEARQRVRLPKRRFQPVIAQVHCTAHVKMLQAAARASHQGPKAVIVQALRRRGRQTRQARPQRRNSCGDSPRSRHTGSSAE